jgi:hypothetical protein
MSLALRGVPLWKLINASVLAFVDQLYFQSDQIQEVVPLFDIAHHLET